MLFELFVLYTIKDGVEKISKRLEEEQKQKEKLQRQQRKVRRAKK
jgi:hypothetical protein